MPYRITSNRHFERAEGESRHEVAVAKSTFNRFLHFVPTSRDYGRNDPYGLFY